MSTSFDPSRVLFVGQGATAICWYRAALPATYLGADWVGLVGDPSVMRHVTGVVQRGTVVPDFEDYDAIVIQQPRGQDWFRFINHLQSKGVKVIYEVDDYLHAIKDMPDHDYREDFDAKELKRLELCMRGADALICSTHYIARRYHRYNNNVYVCENGIDLGRYRLTRPERPSVNVGWAGATGHVKAVGPWLAPLIEVMGEYADVTFVSIGMPFADLLRDLFPGRTLSIPFTMLDTYPAAMTMFDIALAPAGKTKFHRGKSDLRWLEASALGIPVIADPATYPNIEHGVTGFHAKTPKQVGELLRDLVEDAELRTAVGGQAREHVVKERDMAVAVGQWRYAIQGILDG